MQKLSKQLSQQVLSPLSIFYITIDKHENALKLSKGLVENKLAACANIVKNQNNECGIQSVYSWKGNIEVGNEFLLIIKSRTDLLEDICQFVKQNHPYDVPEVICTPIFGGNADYINWVYENTRETEFKQQEEVGKQ